MAQWRVMLLGAVVASTIAGCSGVPGVYTVERGGSGASGAAGAAAGTAAGSGGAFDAAAYVAGIWESEVVPTITDGADDAGPLLAAIAKDPEAAGATYGRRDRKSVV